MEENENSQKNNSINEDSNLSMKNNIKDENIKENEILKEEKSIEDNNNFSNSQNENKIDNLCGKLEESIDIKDEKEKKDKKDKDQNNEEEEREEGEEKDESTNEYIFRCEECHLIPTIKIDLKTYKIHSKCPNNHIKTDINLSKALNENKKFLLESCSICGEKSEEDNYICVQCQKIFCLDGGCKKKHIKENPSHLLIDKSKIDMTCLEHLTTISKFCKDCKKNICIKCQRTQHSGHELIDLGEILPLPEEIENAKKICKEKKEKLLILKRSIKVWMEEFNNKLKILIDSIDAQIAINENILKNHKTDIMNYQMIENFNYFSSKESTEIYSSNELMSFVNEQNWLAKTFLINQILTKLEKPIKIKEEEEKNSNTNNNINNININNNFNKRFSINNKIDVINNDDNLIKKKSKTIVAPKKVNAKAKPKSKDKVNNSINSLNLKYIKTYSSPIPQNQNELINEKDYYCSLNEIKDKKISKKAFKSQVSIKEKIYSGLIDNKGVIFLGSDSSLHIYSFDTKNCKIEKEFTIKGLNGSVNTISELRDDFIIIGTSNNTIKIIEFLGNKKYRIHQEINNLDKNSIYKVIELSNENIVSCDEINIIMLSPIKNNFYEISQEIKLNTPSCCALQISENVVATSHIVLNKISFYEIDEKELKLKKEIENIELTTSNNSMAIINDKYFCSLAKQNIYIISIDNLSITKKIDLKINIVNLFPISFGTILLCLCKDKEKGEKEYSLSLKCLDEKNKELLYDFDQSVLNRNKDDNDDILYLNFFYPNYMIMISKSNLSIWG